MHMRTSALKMQVSDCWAKFLPCHGHEDDQFEFMKRRVLGPPILPSFMRYFSGLEYHFLCTLCTAAKEKRNLVLQNCRSDAGAFVNVCFCSRKFTLQLFYFSSARPVHKPRRFDDNFDQSPTASTSTSSLTAPVMSPPPGPPPAKVARLSGGNRPRKSLIFYA